MNRFAALASVALLASCAARPRPHAVRATELARMDPPSPGQPLVILFEPGDEIPLAVAVGGPLVRSPEGLAPITLEVKERFYLLIEDGKMSASADGESFGDVAEPGSFSFGVGATKAGPKASVRIVTPTLRSGP